MRVLGRATGFEPAPPDPDTQSAIVKRSSHHNTLRHRLRSLIGLTGDFAAYLLVRFLVAVIQTLPMDMGDSMCHGLAWLASGPLGIRRGVTERNLTRVFPDADQQSRRRLSFAMWHHLLLMVCEIAWAQRRLHLSNWSKHVRFRSQVDMLSILLSKRPVVTVTGHFGNFEVGGYVIGLMGFSTTTIARRLDNRFLHAWVERFRGAKGQQMVDKEGCAPIVEEHLKNGGALAILADQHAGDKGCWTDFMGVPASCHKALALFSLSSGAPMLAGYTIRLDGKPLKFESACIAIADPQRGDPACESVNSLTKWYNEQLERSVALAVEQYWWLHRRWREPPPKVAKRLQKRATQKQLAA